jgi:hypothetical protein
MPIAVAGLIKDLQPRLLGETNDAMSLTKSIQIGCSGATVASPSGLPQLIHEQGGQPLRVLEAERTRTVLRRVFDLDPT